MEKNAKQVRPVRLVIENIPKRRGMDPAEIANRLKEADKKMVAVIVEVSDKVQIVIAAGDEAVRSGINAGEIVSMAAKIVGGGGGGRAFFASGGGPDKDKAAEAVRAIAENIQQQVSVPAAEEAT